MTLLGRIFIGLILVLSVAFCAISVVVIANHKDWKQAGQAFQQKNQQLATNIQELQRTLDATKRDLEQEQVGRRVTLGLLQTQLDQERERLAQLTGELQKLQATNTIQTQALAATQDELARVTKENTEIKAQIVQVVKDRDDQTRKAISLQDDLNNRLVVLSSLNKQLDTIRDSATILEARNISMKNAMDRAGVKDDLADPPPSTLTGLVNAVDQKGLIEISVGQDDGLREGHELEVYRGAQYLGRIQIIRTDVDKSIGKIMNEYRRGYIQKDDRVVAKLGS